MSIDLTDPIFNDEAKAWKHFEAIRWPNGPVCPHCGVVNAADPIIGKTARAGLYRCHDCRKQFTATVGTIFERSHIPMHKWLLATHLLCSSKKGISAHQLYRNLGFGSYRTAWFMAHRIREAMGLGAETSEGSLQAFAPKVGNASPQKFASRHPQSTTMGRERRLRLSCAASRFS